MFGKMKIGTRLIGSFGVVIAMFMVIQLQLGIQLAQVKDSSEQIRNETLPFVTRADEMMLSVSQVQQFLTDVSATRDRAAYAEAEAAAQRFLSGVGEFRAMYGRENDTESLKQLDIIEKRFHAFYAMGKEMSEAYVTEGVEAGNVVMEKFDVESQSLGLALGGFREQQVKEGVGIAEFVGIAVARLYNWMIGGSIAGGLLALAFALWITRSLTRQLGGELNRPGF